MPDQVIPPPDADPVLGTALDPALADRVRDDLATVTELVASGVEVDGEMQVAASTWVVYGHSAYDGETIVGVYHDEVEATEVVHLAPHAGRADENGPGS
jgi:hypothetical protein